MPTHHRMAVLALFIFFGAVSGAFPQRTKKERQDNKTVWNYDGGVFFVTDGELPDGVCFRVSGRMNSGDFFDGLRRIDSNQDTVFQRGPETVTKFPDSVTISFAIRDQLCPADGLRAHLLRSYLTQKMIDDLKLSIYWKHGVDLRAVREVKEESSRVERVSPYAATLAADLPPRYEWSYEFVVPSAGVPITNSLAFVFRTPDGRIAARVAARL